MKRLNARERVMLIGIGAILFVLLNLAILNTLRSGFSAKGETLRARLSDRDSLRQILDEKKLWEDRDAWLTEHLPKLESEDRAAVSLLEEVKTLASSQNVLVENPQLGVVEHRPHCRAVSVTLETRSSWDALVCLLYELQKPERFNVIESVNLQIDSNDPTRMRGRFRIARWHAPAGQ